MVAAAQRGPDELVVGVDANPSGLGVGFERAARRGLSNTLFVVATAEAPPSELRATADELVVQFPWGSLLDAVLTPGETMRSLVGLLVPGGTFRLSLSVTPRDHVVGLHNLDDETAHQLAERVADACNVDITGIEPLSWPEVRASGSSWAKRLGVGRSRSGFQLTFGHPPGG